MYTLPTFLQVFLRWLIRHGQTRLAGWFYLFFFRTTKRWKLACYDLASFKAAEPKQRWAILAVFLINTFGKVEKDVDCDGTSWSGSLGGLHYHTSNWSGTWVAFTLGKFYRVLYSD